MNNLKVVNSMFIQVDEHGNPSVKFELCGTTHHVHLFFDAINDEYCVYSVDAEYTSGSFSDAMTGYCDFFVSFQSEIPCGLVTLLNNFQDTMQYHYDQLTIEADKEDEQQLIANAENNVIGYIWDLNGTIPHCFSECYVIHHSINGVNYYYWRIDHNNATLQSEHYYHYDKLDQCSLDCYNAFKELSN